MNSINLNKTVWNIGSIILVIVIVIIVLLVFLLLIGSIYRINTGEGAILTQTNGIKVAVIDVGWHKRMPFLTDLNVKSIVNNNIYFPSDYLELEAKFQGDLQSGAIGYDIKTTDDKVVDTGAVMSFEIVDIIQYGVKNTRPEEQLQKAFDSIVFDYLQAQSSDKITNQISLSNKEGLAELKKSYIEKQFGIKINTFSLLRPTFTRKALDALAEKQAIQATSEGELNAARNRAEAIETIARAQKNQSDLLKNVSATQLDFNSRLALYDTFKSVNQNQTWIWVVPYGQPITISK